MTTLEALALVALTTAGTQTVQQTRSAAKDVRISIENPAGTLRIVGWDRAEVSISGTLCDRAEGLEVIGSERSLSIDVEGSMNPHRCDCDLEVKVPAGSHLQVDTYSAPVTATGLTGTLQVDSVHGGFRIEGRLQDFQADTVAGTIELTGATARTRAESVNGSVTLRGVTGDVEASTVNGLLHVTGTALRRLQLETVAGAIRFEGTLADGAMLESSSVSGGIEVALPANVDASFDLSSFSGAIVNELSSDRPRRGGVGHDGDDDDHGHGGMGNELSFRLGAGNAQVHVETLSGRIRLAPR
jgi:DUF4097 and DUF4098 domain-containing protein YvlB